MNTLKDRLKYARELRELSQGDLAKLAKCSQSTIGNVESGERDTLRNLVMVARVLKCSADWLYDGFGEKPVKYQKSNTAHAITAAESVVSYMPSQKHDPQETKLLELFHQLDEKGKNDWLKDLGGFVRGSRPHTHGTAPAVAGKK